MEHEMETILRTYRGHGIWTLRDNAERVGAYIVHHPHDMDNVDAKPIGFLPTLSAARRFVDQEIRDRRWDDAAGLNG